MALLTRPLVWMLFVLGCVRAVRPDAPLDHRQTPLESARSRPLPVRIQGKFSFTVRSERNDFAASTAGVVILDRATIPPRGHLAVLGPLGGPLATLQTSSGGASVALARQRQHLVAENAEHVLRETTSGVVGLDDLLGLFVGDLPLDAVSPRSEHVSEGGIAEVLLDGPEGTTLSLEIDTATATPRTLIARDKGGRVMLDVHYAPFGPQTLDASALSPPATAEVTLWLPTDLTVALPGLDLDLEVHMKSWSVPSPMPDVFGIDAPEGFSSSPLEDVLRQWAARSQ